MDEAEIIRALTDLDGVVAVTASEENGAPQAAWGDSFFFYDPDDDERNRQLPFATIVTQDYAGFDTASHLDRPGVFRLNLAVGRNRFSELFGFSPAEFADRRSEFDFSALDRIIPHPAYATQGWISVLLPGADTEDQVRQLLVHAYEQAKRRHRPRPTAAARSEPNGADG